MSLFEQLGGKPQQVSPQQALGELKAHPMQALKGAGYTIPEGMTDPQQMINHLVNSGQIPNQRLQMAQRIMSNPILGRMFGK